MTVFARALAVALLAACAPAAFAPVALAQIADNPAAVGVLGQTDFVTRTSGTTASKFNGPNGVAVDLATGAVFVADRTNNRVLRFSSAAALQNGGAAEAVFGQATFATVATGLAANRMNNPIGVHVDASGRLWVADFGNNRVLRFDGAATKASGADADGVLGQATFTTGAAGLSATGMRGPVTAYPDAQGRLWVTEFTSHRVTRFDNAAASPNGDAADGVLGQPDFTSGAAGLSATALSSPNGSYVDPQGRLYVSDSGNRRVTRFDNAAASPNGDAADGVLGQPDFVTNVSAVTRAGMTSLRFVTGDSQGRLFVIQEASNRITVYENAATKPNGADADYVIGQPDFTTGTAPNPPTASSFNTPRAIVIDEARDAVWVADFVNNRVLRFAVPYAGNAFLTLAAPNGGETLAIGATTQIRWASGDVTEVRIEYSVDNGTTWTLIATVPAAAGQYTWTVPNTPTTTGRVRITDTATPSLQDVSAGPFSIAVPTESVTLVSPNGYQQWVARDTRRVLFTTLNVATVDLAYSLDDGQTWLPIVSGLAASAGSYQWTLPAQTSAQARVRVTKAGDTSVADVSDRPLTIVADPTGHPQDFVYFADSPTGGFLDPSYAFANAPSAVENQSTKLPLTTDFSFVGNRSVRLRWTSGAGGDWGAALAAPGFVGRDVTTKDTLEFRVFTETTIEPGALPVVFLEDQSNRRSPRQRLATLSGPWLANTWTHVRIPLSLFTANPGSTDFTRIKTVFFGQDAADGQQRTVYLDDVRMSGEIITGGAGRLIVVIGSSTAAGTGASTADSSWVGRYRRRVQQVDPTARVVNLAIGGYTTYDLMPTGFTPPSGRPTPKPNNNITAALSYEPDVIIVNLPSNDTNIGVSVPEQLANLRTFRTLATNANIPIWTMTTQPRNFASDALRQAQIAARDSILTQFAPRALNVWDGLATATGTIVPAFDSGDGIHLNDAGHRLIYDRVVAAGLATFPTADAPADAPAREYALDQNYPNPFSRSTSIRFSLPEATGNVSVRVFDLLGRRVADLVSGPLDAGVHTVQLDASALSSGVYLYRLEAAGQVLTRRLILTR